MFQLIVLCLELFNTKDFQSGFALDMIKKFRSSVIITVIYLLLSIGLHVWTLTLRYGGFYLNFIVKKAVTCSNEQKFSIYEDHNQKIAFFIGVLVAPSIKTFVIISSTWQALTNGTRVGSSDLSEKLESSMVTTSSCFVSLSLSSEAEK